MDETRIIAAILTAGMLAKGHSTGENAKTAVDTFLEVEKMMRAHGGGSSSASASSSSAASSSVKS